jgi:hypothetical protein
MTKEPTIQIKLSTILISMVVAFLLFTNNGNNVLAALFFILIPAPLYDLVAPPMPLIIVATVVGFIFRNQIAAWWRARHLGKRIY